MNLWNKYSTTVQMANPAKKYPTNSNPPTLKVTKLKYEKYAMTGTKIIRGTYQDTREKVSKNLDGNKGIDSSFVDSISCPSESFTLIP